MPNSSATSLDAAGAISWEPTPAWGTDLTPAPRSRRPSKPSTLESGASPANSAPASPVTQRDKPLRPHSTDGHAPPSVLAPSNGMVTAPSSPARPPAPPLPPKSPRHQHHSSLAVEHEPLPVEAIQTIRGSATTPLSFLASATTAADDSTGTLTARGPSASIPDSPRTHKVSASFPTNFASVQGPATAPNSPAVRQFSLSSSTRSTPARSKPSATRGEHKRGPSVLMVDGQSFLIDDVKAAKKKSDAAAAAAAVKEGDEGDGDSIITDAPTEASADLAAVPEYPRGRSDTITTITTSNGGAVSTAPTSSEIARSADGAAVPLGEEVPDDDVVGEDDKPPPGSYAIHPPTSRQLAEASDCMVFDEDGHEVRFGDIFATQRTLVCFLRHWWCGFCQEFAMSLKNVDPLPLTRAGLNLIVIGQGHWHVTKAYKSVMEVPFPMYADPGRHIYRALGMTVRTNDAGPACAKPDYIQMGMTKSIMVAIKKGLLDMPIRAPGDMKLLGGEFILGPGQTCSFTHRMVTTRGHLDLPRILLQAGCDLTLRTPRQIGEEPTTPTSRSLRGSKSSRVLRQSNKLAELDNLVKKKEKKDKKKALQAKPSANNGRSSVSTDYARDKDADMDNLSVAGSNASAPGIGGRIAKGFHLGRRKSNAAGTESLRSASGSDWEPVPSIPTAYASNGNADLADSEAARYKMSQSLSLSQGKTKPSLFSSKRFRKLASLAPAERATESAPASRASSVRSAAPEVLRPAELRQLWANQARGASEGMSRMSSSTSFRSSTINGASSSMGHSSISSMRRGTREGIEALGFQYDSNASSDSESEAESEAQSAYAEARNNLRRGSAVEDVAEEAKSKGYGKGSRSATDLTTPEHAKGRMLSEAAATPLPKMPNGLANGSGGGDTTPVLRADKPLPNGDATLRAAEEAEVELTTPKANQISLPEQPAEEGVPATGRRGSIKDLTAAALASASVALSGVAAKGATVLRPPRQRPVNGDGGEDDTGHVADHEAAVQEEAAAGQPASAAPTPTPSKKSFHLRSGSASSATRNRSVSLGSSGLGLASGLGAAFHMPRRKSKAGPPVPEKDFPAGAWPVDEREDMRREFESRIDNGDLLRPEDAEHTAPSSDLHAPNSAVHAAMIAAANRGSEDEQVPSGAPSSFFVDGLDAFDALPGTRPRNQEYWLEDQSTDDVTLDREGGGLPAVSGPQSPEESDWDGEDDRSIVDSLREGDGISADEDEEDLGRYTFDEVRGPRDEDSGEDSAGETTPPSSAASGFSKSVGNVKPANLDNAWALASQNGSLFVPPTTNGVVGGTPILETKIIEEDEEAVQGEEDVPEDVTEDEGFDDDDEVATIEAAHHVAAPVSAANSAHIVEPSTLQYDDESDEEEMDPSQADLLPGATLSNALRRRGTTGLLSPSRLSVFTEEDEDEVRTQGTSSRMSVRSGTDTDDEEARDALAPLETEVAYGSEADNERPLRLLKEQRRKSDDAVHPSVVNALNRLVAAGGNADSMGIVGGFFHHPSADIEQPTVDAKPNGQDHLSVDQPAGGRSRGGSLSFVHQFDDADEEEEEDGGTEMETETEGETDAETEMGHRYGRKGADAHSFDETASYVSQEHEWRADAPPDAADNFFS